MQPLTDEQLKKLKEIGETIKNRREELSFSLSKVSDIIRVNSAELRAIEQGDYAGFPDLVFLRGFIRNYCKLLELDSSWMISIINDFFDGTKKTEEPALKKQLNARVATRVRGIVFSILGLVIVGAGGFFIYNRTIAPSTPKLVPAFANSSPVAAAAKSLNLVVSAKKAGWVQLTLDEEEPQNIALIPGQNLTWTAAKHFKLTLSRGDAAEIFINDVKSEIPASDADLLFSLDYSEPG